MLCTSREARPKRNARVIHVRCKRSETHPICLARCRSDGHVGFDEMFELLHGHRHSLDSRNKRVEGICIEVPPDVSFSLSEMAWNVETLRILMRQMLERNHIGPADLIAAWDDDGSGDLSHRMFCNHMRSLFGQNLEQVWQNEILPIVHQAFADIVGLWKGASGLHLM